MSSAEQIVAFEGATTRTAVVTSSPITVTALVAGTSCPNLSFTVGTYVFRVDASTQYSGGACSGIQAGSRISITATRDSETSTQFSVSQLSFATTSTPPPPQPPASTPVTTEGTITAIGAGMCPELQFLFGSYAFNVSYATQYTSGSCADLKPGARVGIVGAKRDGESFVRVSGLTFKSNPTPPSAPAPTPVSAEVTVSSLVPGTSCPNLAFMVGPYRIEVSGATTYVNGACADISANARLKLTGSRQGEGAVIASAIEFRAPATPEPPSSRPVEGEGVISSLKTGTSCPAIEFYIGSYLIVADAATVFDAGSCSDLGAGTRVHVTGAVAGDGRVLASRLAVRTEAPRYPAAEGEGRVGSLVSGTACPSLTFTIGEYTVTLNGATAFIGGTCTDVAVGRRLGVKAVITGDKQALATEIAFRND
jgi:hypothetical protein